MTAATCAECRKQTACPLLAAALKDDREIVWRPQAGRRARPRGRAKDDHDIVLEAASMWCAVGTRTTTPPATCHLPAVSNARRSGNDAPFVSSSSLFALAFYFRSRATSTYFIHEVFVYAHNLHL